MQGVDPPLQASPVFVAATSTLPADEERLIVPVASGAGSSAPEAAEASLTRK